MANFIDKLNEIKTHLSSNIKSHKPFAYSTLLHLQEQSTIHPSLIQSLSDSSHSLLSSILNDIYDDDEEIAAQALKCLGFMTYHPFIVAAISGDDANVIVNSLEKVITATKIKSICNLGVWCISTQQFNTALLAAHFQSLLRAIIHALDNPIGSLSTTFEAMQAVMKLASQLSEKMRETSNIWAPPIYRRLVSADKREKDMAERCLLKIRSPICPPPLALSKALALDMKKKLLPAMKELLNHGMKIQSLQAWGWFIRLLGPYATKNRHLVNEMLKIPEQTFSDLDPQVQIASQVAWEGLIDALIHPPIRAPETNAAGVQQVTTSKGNKSEIEADGFSKRIKLIMTPLVGIISSKCDVSVHSTCLNTWSYLLHKLDTSVYCPSVIKMVWEPIFEGVFRFGPDSRNILLWNFCLDLLDNFALARSTDVSLDLNNQRDGQLAAQTPIIGPHVSGKCSWKHYPIKWLPWDLSQLDFYIKMIHILISHRSMATAAPEIKSLACHAALKIFRSVLKGVQNVLKSSSVTYDEVLLCLNTILLFLKKLCEDADSEDDGVNDLHHTSLQFVEVITEELEPSILGSPLYKVALDLKYIDNFKSVNEFRHAKMLGIWFTDYMSMVSPIVYLTTLYFCVVVRATLNAPEAEPILQGIFRYVRFLLSSYDPPEVLHAFIGLLYKHLVSNCLNIWIAIANCMKDHIDGVKGLSLLKNESENPGYLVVCQLLSHPFAVFSCRQRQLTPVNTSGSLKLCPISPESQKNVDLEHVMEVWKSLYVSVNHASRYECPFSRSFSEDLSSMLNGFLDANTSVLVSGTELDPREKNQDPYLFSLWGDVVICIVEQILISEVSCKGSKGKDDGSCRRSSGINNSLEFAARFMKLSWTNAATNPPTGLLVTSRVFSTLVRFLGCLHFKEDVISFLEIISGPLLQWLSDAEVQDENTNPQLQLLWIEILNCLQMSRPPIHFDSSFLKLQAPLLQRTLDHPNPSISEPTITFWNSSYAEQIKLDYPQSLLPVLDKLSRNGKITLFKRSHPISEKGHSGVDVIRPPRGYKVTGTLNRTVKRVELVENTVNGIQHTDNLSLRSKRKGPELTEHQKEVRRAQQGRSRDCEGRGPGIRTYTSVDFSQGNEESQESQDIGNVETILEILRRDGNLS